MSAIQQLKICLAALVLACAGLGCSDELSEEEMKKAEQEMQQLDSEMSEILPAKLK